MKNDFCGDMRRGTGKSLILKSLLFLLSCLSPAVMFGAEPVPVFVLHSYTQDHPLTGEQHEAFVTALQEDVSRSYRFNVEYLDT
jgi:hypothetical protein